jgi:hypothetical protein
MKNRHRKFPERPGYSDRSEALERRLRRERMDGSEADQRTGTALRFWRKVDKTGPCWTWKAQKRKRGYGNFQFQGRGEMFSMAAHRVAFRLAKGFLPKNACVCHRCDNPSCVRPSHLFLGTPKDNVDDSMKKGRFLRNHRTFYGENHGFHKLTLSQVETIRHLRKEGVGPIELARQFRTDRKNIWLIVTNQAWSAPVNELRKKPLVNDNPVNLPAGEG